MAPPRRPSPDGQVSLDGAGAPPEPPAPYTVTIGDTERGCGTPAAVLVLVGRAVVDMDAGKLEIAVERQETDEAR